MSNIVPFDSPKLPSYLAKKEPGGNLAAIAAASSGFPVISIKGKVFHIKRGDEKTLITKPGADDEPAANIEVVILGIGPEGGNYAKQFYVTGFTEGSDAKPDCYSNDGIAPAPDAQAPQASKCATCKHNVFGSRITDSGGKGKACADSKRLAVAQPGALGDPMLIRVPAASLKGLREFAKALANRGVCESQAVVTKIGFDYTVAHPQLTFKPVGFLDEATYAEAMEASQTELVQTILGITTPVAAEDEFESPKPKAEPKAEKPAASAKPKAEKPKADDLPVEKKAAVKVEGDDEAPAKPKAKVVEAVSDDLDAALDDLDFDD